MTIHPNAKTGAHHHGPVESVIYVVKGRARMRWGERLDCALQRPFNPALASNVCKSRIESLLANRGDVYNPHSDHLAGSLVQQGLSVAVNIAPWIHVEARQINAIR